MLAQPTFDGPAGCKNDQLSLIVGLLASLMTFPLLNSPAPQLSHVSFSSEFAVTIRSKATGELTVTLCLTIVQRRDKFGSRAFRFGDFTEVCVIVEGADHLPHSYRMAAKGVVADMAILPATLPYTV